MAIPVKVKIANTELQLFFGANALRVLEKSSGYATQTIGLMLVTGRGGFGLLLEAIYAGIEGARLKGLSDVSLSLDEVGDLVDTHPGGIEALFDNDSEFSKQFMEAWRSAFPSRDRKDLPPPDPPQAAAVPDQSQAPTSGGTT